jgi:hypothetical protein
VAKNRIEVSPAEPMLASPDGYVTPEFVAFTQRFALGGAAIEGFGGLFIGDGAADNHVQIGLRFEGAGLVAGGKKALKAVEQGLRIERPQKQGVYSQPAFLAERAVPTGLIQFCHQQDRSLRLPESLDSGLQAGQADGIGSNYGGVDLRVKRVLTKHL